MSDDRGAGRELFVDTTRGVAMMTVLVAHFVWIYFGRNPGTPFDNLFTFLYFGPPTFMLTSGLLVGYMYDRRPERFEAFRVKLVNRGLFLLTIGHVVISLAYVNYGGGLAGSFRNGQILDAIGVSLIIAPLVVTRTTIRTRFFVAAAVLGLCWLLILSWRPVDGTLGFLMSTMVGGGGWWVDNFPIVPWMCLYLMGTCLGQALERLLRDGDARGVRILLARVGLGAIFAAVALIAAGRVLRSADWVGPEAADAIARVTSPFLKLPPSPVHFAFFGGVGVLLILCVFLVVQSERLPRATRLAAIVGQNSLFIFLLQEHIYVLLLWSWNPPYVAYWPLLLLATMIVPIGATYVWHLLGWSRFMTVGYGQWWGPREQPARARPS